MSPDQLRQAVADLETNTTDLPEIPVDENVKSKVNPKRQKLAELAASLKSSNKTRERARKRKERENTSSKKDKLRKKRRTVEDDDDASPRDNDEESDTEENGESREPSVKKILKRKRVRMQDSDESDEDALHIYIEENNEENHNEFSNKPDEITSGNMQNVHNEDGRSRELADDSEESDNEQVVRNGGRSPEQQNKNESSDEGSDVRKRGRPEDEDIEISDDDLDIPLIRTKRARQLVLDDDDE